MRESVHAEPQCSSITAALVIFALSHGCASGLVSCEDQESAPAAQHAPATQPNRSHTASDVPLLPSTDLTGDRLPAIGSTLDSFFERFPGSPGKIMPAAHHFSVICNGHDLTLMSAFLTPEAMFFFVFEDHALTKILMPLSELLYLQRNVSAEGIRFVQTAPTMSAAELDSALADARAAQSTAAGAQEPVPVPPSLASETNRKYSRFLELSSGISARKVQLGMTKAAVEAAIGHPTLVHEDNGQLLWLFYVSEKLEPFRVPSLVLSIEDEKVASMFSTEARALPETFVRSILKASRACAK